MLARVLALPLLAAAAAAQPLEIVNLHGDINLEIVPTSTVEAWRSGADSSESPGIAISRSPVRVLAEALPPEGQESPHIEVRLPLGVPFTARTDAGDINLVGMVRRASLQSAQGSLSLSVPLDLTVLDVESSQRPGVVDVPPEHSMALLSDLMSIGPKRWVWKLLKSHDSRGEVYGFVKGQLHSPAVLRVRDWPIPDDWPLKPHTSSKAVVDRLVAQSRRRQRGQPEAARARRPSPARRNEPAGESLFRSEVRMVSLSVAVSDSGGRPMLDLEKEDFIVEEAGLRQEIRVADPEESPFNLAVLLDLSGSTATDLGHMRQATRRMIELARPNDRLALYAMSQGMFHRLAPLTSDRGMLIRRLGTLPYPVGGSPLWDTIVVAYDDELASLPGERNALVVISDGIDNRISGHNAPSMLAASRLIQVAGEMDTRIYPIFLLSGERFGRNWSNKARKRMESLAQKTGGRLFTARSVADIEPVLPHLAREMRSVYEIAYYPADQDFDGNWRRVAIKVSVPGAQVRARPGYFAD